jgi:TM2 domain-containing membrane protein YozV
MNIERPGKYLCPSCGGPIAVGPTPDPLIVVTDPSMSIATQTRGYWPEGTRGRLSYDRSSKSRVGFVLLGLFLGMWGIHNFYAGHAGRGIAQLLITIFLWWLIVPLFCVAFWVIIEVCVVNRDGEGRRMV